MALQKRPQVPFENRNERSDCRTLRSRYRLSCHQERNRRGLTYDRHRGDHLLFPVYRLLRHGSGRMRMACTFGTHAHANPRNRHVHRHDREPGNFGHHRIDIPLVGRLMGIRPRILQPRRIYGRLLYCSSVLLARNQGTQPRRNRTVLQDRMPIYTKMTSLPVRSVTFLFGSPLSVSA